MQRTPVRTGVAPYTRVYWTGALGMRSLNVILPLVLVITNSAKAASRRGRPPMQ